MSSEAGVSSEWMSVSREEWEACEVRVKGEACVLRVQVNAPVSDSRVFGCERRPARIERRAWGGPSSARVRLVTLQCLPTAA